MDLSFRQAVDRLYQPGYVGDNRCLPCTVVNLLIAVVIGAVIATAWLPGGVFAVMLAGIVIYFRGYLVPGTPTLTKRYLPAPVLHRFDKRERGSVTTGTEAEPTVDVEAQLVACGVVAECANWDDLCLDPEFRSAWYDRIAELRGQRPDQRLVVTMFGLDEEHLSLHEADGVITATFNPPGGRWRRIGQWESSASFLADAAGAEAIRPRLSTWPELSVQDRTAILYGLRLFLDECPACRGAVGFGEEAVQSCCGPIDVMAVTCEACEARLFEAELTGEPRLA